MEPGILSDTHGLVRHELSANSIRWTLQANRTRSAQPKALASIFQKGWVAYINSGSVGPRRFTLPVTLVRATIIGNRITSRLVSLQV